MDQFPLLNAKITKVIQETPSIKIFTLEHDKADYKFKSGQWIDLHLDPELIGHAKNIGGYTIISTPKQPNKIELAVRESNHHPVTQFLHSPQALNTTVQITEGQGKFYLNPAHKSLCPVFIAGGIGVTPILSMTREMAFENDNFKLFYSASFFKDFVLKKELKKNSIFTVTKEKATDEVMQNGRIDFAFLEKFLDSQKINTSPFYICGPREMIDSVKSDLLKLGVRSNFIFHEKWW